MSELINPLSKIKISDENPDSFKMNFAALEEGSGQSPITNNEPAEQPKKRGRPPKQKPMSNGQIMIAAVDNEDMSMIQSNAPYISTYGETNMLTRGTIADVDRLNNTVSAQLEAVVESKTLRKKYDYISELSSTAATLLSTKLRAISEMNKVISDAHGLDLRRAKELNLSKAQDDSNDDKRMMDFYTAFVNTPVGSYGAQPPAFPTMVEMTMPGQVTGIDMSGPLNAAMGASGVDSGYMSWQQNMSPEERRMLAEKNNPNIQTVVVYDQTTNNKYFDVIDKNTGQSIPNMPKPDSFLLADTYPNLNNHTARNSNIDAVYPLVVVGQPESLMDF